MTRGRLFLLCKYTISSTAIVYRVPRRADVSRGNSQVLSSRSRRCIDPWHPLAPRSPILPTLSRPLATLPPFAAVFLLPPRPSSSFLVPRYAHTLAVTSRGQHVGEFKHAPFFVSE